VADTPGLKRCRTAEGPPVEAWVDLFKTTGSSPPPHRTQSSSGRRRR
jgi:hypothetical protein